MAQRFSPQTKQAVRRLVSDGWSMAEISRWTGIHKATLRRWCASAESMRAENDRALGRYKANSDRINKRHKEYYRETRDHQLSMASAYRRKNAAQVNCNTAKRRAQKGRATPPWLSREQEQAIRALYVECRRLQDETGIPHNVDHIHPLQGQTVCGLHVPWNLQILTAEDNLAKSNLLY